MQVRLTWAAGLRAGAGAGTLAALACLTAGHLMGSPLPPSEPAAGSAFAAGLLGGVPYVWLCRFTSRPRLTFAIVTILLSWAFIHLVFALHYAHEYYDENDGRGGGLIFPGDEDPDYWDFLYYALVVAMTAQVSDVQITNKSIRRLTTVHGVISFFFNVTVLAFTINIVSTLMQ